MGTLNLRCPSFLLPLSEDGAQGSQQSLLKFG